MACLYKTGQAKLCCNDHNKIKTKTSQWIKTKRFHFTSRPDTHQGVVGALLSVFSLHDPESGVAPPWISLKEEKRALEQLNPAAAWSDIYHLCLQCIAKMKYVGEEM